jgi:hypothetical protein
MKGLAWWNLSMGVKAEHGTKKLAVKLIRARPDHQWGCIKEGAHINLIFDKLIAINISSNLYLA